MFHRFHTAGALSNRTLDLFHDGQIPFPLVSVPLLVGLMFGSIIGLFSSVPADFCTVFSFFPEDGFSVGFSEALWRSSLFVIISLLLASSFLGFVFLPALSAVRGFLLGFGVAVSFQTEGLRGLLLALLTFGFPALLGLSAFLLVSSYCAACSIQLLRCFSRGENRPLEKPFLFPRRIAVVFFLCFLEALYSAFLLPAITGFFQ